MTYPVIATIVEGHGEVQALPVLLRRLAVQLHPSGYVDAATPHRVPRDTLLKPGGLETAMTTLIRQFPHANGILVLLDADDDCPVEMANDLKIRAQQLRSDITVSVVLPMIEFEAWFLAAASSLAGRYGLPEDLKEPDDCESVRGAKEWISKRMSGNSTYQPPAHQAGFVKHFDIALARKNSPSFDKFCRDVARLMAGS